MDSLDEHGQSIENDKVSSELDKGLGKILGMAKEVFRDKFDFDFIEAVKALDDEHKRTRIEEVKRKSHSE